MRSMWYKFFYSFPVQLVIIHLRSNLIFLALWVFLVMLINGYIAQKLGIRYLFLDPEYLGAVSFWSFFIPGLAFGGFLLTWNLTTYLLTSHHFPFLATLARPFTKFCLNNLILPGAFLLFYLIKIIEFQGVFSQAGFEALFYYCFGFLSGFLTTILVYFMYFYYTNKDISFYETGKPIPPNLNRPITPGRPDVDLDEIKLDDRRWRVDTYLNEYFRLRLVRSVAHYDASMLLSIFRQNHLNALIIQLFTIILLILLGWLIEYPVFRIPAAASLLIFFSIIVAIVGALSYWLNRWRTTVILVLLVLINWISSFDIGKLNNRAYGLDYSPDARPEYSYDKLLAHCSSEQVELDRRATIGILERWKANTGQDKPKMIILCVSGGGLRSATWTMHVTQTADRMLGGKLLDHTVLITGASGGMLGMAYLRELMLQKENGADINLYDRKYLDHLSQDLLNPVAFAFVANDLFLPISRFEKNGKRYRKDRGYFFEKQLNENTNYRLDKPIREYRDPEKAATIPLLFITPSVVNDARRMIISPQGVSYMMVAPIGFEKTNSVEVDAVDFGWLFESADAQNLNFTSALRMNATYPYILPSVHLPSKPEIEVMDAGFRDNYGILSATRFIQVFQDWIRANTSGVVLLQIASSEKIEDIRPSEGQGVIEALFNPFDIPHSFLSLQEFEQDNSLGFIYDILGPDMFKIVRFIYQPGYDGTPVASISFHISEREKEVVMEALDEKDNQSNLRRLLNAFHLAANN